MVEDNEQGRGADEPGNVTKGGRYGTAPPDKPHIRPEVAPLGRGGIEVPREEAETLPGALPENGSREASRADDDSTADWGE